MLALLEARLSAVIGRAVDPLFRLELASLGVDLSPHVTVCGRPIVTVAPDSEIRIGEAVVLVSRSRQTALGVSRPVILRTLRPGALIQIGPDSGLSGTTICSQLEVVIGARVLIGADVIVSD